MMRQNTMTKRGPRGRAVRLGSVDFQQETAQYITDIVLELHNLARSAKLKTLNGLLGLAYYEASSLAKKVDIPADEVKRLKALEAAAKDMA